MGMDQAKRLKELEVENKRLKTAVADLTLDNQILKDVASGNFFKHVSSLNLGIYAARNIRNTIF